MYPGFDNFLAPPLALPAIPIQLMHIKSLLLHFATYTGVKVNYAKSTLIAINTPDDKMQALSALMGCQIGSLPLPYLGMPLKCPQTKGGRFFPLIKRIETRLQGCSILLSYGDKLVLIKSVFASMPIFYMSILAIPMTIVQQINKYLRKCFWRRYGSEEKTPALIAWDKACLPKSHGGSGILDIPTHNQALLMKFLHKFFNKHDLPWLR